MTDTTERPQTSAGVPASRLASLRRREDATFTESRPRSRALLERARGSMPNGVPMSWMAELYEHPPIFVALGEGATFTDVDGHRYFDTNIGDMSTFCGINPPAVVEAVARQARRGLQYLLPIEDALWVAEDLTRRFRLPQWQFTLSATLANVEAIRLCRFVTGRPVVLMFEGKYHGHAEEWLVDPKDGALRPAYPGVPPSAGAWVRHVPFNDPEALERVLTEEGYARTAELGARLADGIDERCRRRGFDWRAHRLFARSGYCYGPALPRNASDYHATMRPDLYHLMRVYFANRGVWEAIGTAGPTVSVAAAPADIDHYLACLDEFLGELSA